MSRTTTELQVVDLQDFDQWKPRPLMTLDVAVKRGAQFLDQWHPDWFTRVDTDLLDMSDPFCCIVGQVAYAWHTYYWNVIRDHATPHAEQTLTILFDESLAFTHFAGDGCGSTGCAGLWAVKMSVPFALGFDGSRLEYPTLRTLWIGQVMRRQIEAGL